MLHSIIVPVYKVEKYLPKCIDSLLNQDLPESDYEIILVDDGSPDRCGQICDEYADKYANIHVIHQQNGGLSAARNAGIKLARGKYIQFVDSDDYLEPNVLGMLLKRMESDQLDILRFNYQNVDEAGAPVWQNKTPKQDWGYQETTTDGHSFLNERLGLACYAVQFIISAEILKNELFIEDIYFEDVEWTPRILQKAARVSSSSNICYNYLVRNGSISKSKSDGQRRKSINDRITVISYLSEQCGSSNCKWYRLMISNMVLSVLSDVSIYFYEERRHFVKRLQTLHVLPIDLQSVSSSAKYKKGLINISPMLFCHIYRILV